MPVWYEKCKADWCVPEKGREQKKILADKIGDDQKGRKKSRKGV